MDGGGGEGRSRRAGAKQKARCVAFITNLEGREIGCRLTREDVHIDARSGLVWYSHSSGAWVANPPVVSEAHRRVAEP